MNSAIGVERPGRRRTSAAVIAVHVPNQGCGARGVIREGVCPFAAIAGVVVDVPVISLTTEGAGSAVLAGHVRVGRLVPRTDVPARTAVLHGGGVDALATAALLVGATGGKLAALAGPAAAGVRLQGVAGEATPIAVIEAGLCINALSTAAALVGTAGGQPAACAVPVLAGIRGLRVAGVAARAAVDEVRLNRGAGRAIAAEFILRAGIAATGAGTAVTRFVGAARVATRAAVGVIRPGVGAGIVAARIATRAGSRTTTAALAAGACLTRWARIATAATVVGIGLRIDTGTSAARLPSATWATRAAGADPVDARRPGGTRLADGSTRAALLITRTSLAGTAGAAARTDGAITGADPALAGFHRRARLAAGAAVGPVAGGVDAGLAAPRCRRLALLLLFLLLFGVDVMSAVPLLLVSVVMILAVLFALLAGLRCALTEERHSQSGQ